MIANSCWEEFVEYQYYDFRTVDRRLSSVDMKRLRDLSTRAEITPTGFTNHYEWGDFKGDPRKLMWQYFDAFLYLANWGTRRLMLRLPADLIDRKRFEAYCFEGGPSVEVKGEHALLEFNSDEEGGDWDHDGVGLLDEMLPLREALIGGDLRPLHVAWLSGVHEALGWEALPDVPEPPLPPGMKKLTPAMKALAEFLRVPDDLLAIASEVSPDGPDRAGPTREELAARVASLPESDRNAILLGLLTSEPDEARRVLLRRLRQVAPQALPPAGVTTGRTGRALLAAAEAAAEERRRRAAERAARERAKREAEAAAKRAKYLEQLAAHEEDAWKQVEAKIESKQQDEYDAAVSLLKDLRDVSVNEGSGRSFEARVRALHARHTKKSTFVKRLQKAGMLRWGGAG